MLFVYSFIFCRFEPILNFISTPWIYSCLQFKFFAVVNFDHSTILDQEYFIIPDSTQNIIQFSDQSKIKSCWLPSVHAATFLFNAILSYPLRFSQQMIESGRVWRVLCNEWASFWSLRKLWFDPLKYSWKAQTMLISVYSSFFVEIKEITLIELHAIQFGFGEIEFCLGKRKKHLKFVFYMLTKCCAARILWTSFKIDSANYLA